MRYSERALESDNMRSLTSTARVMTVHSTTPRRATLYSVSSSGSSHHHSTKSTTRSPSNHHISVATLPREVFFPFYSTPLFRLFLSWFQLTSKEDPMLVPSYVHSLHYQMLLFLTLTGVEDVQEMWALLSLFFCCFLLLVTKARTASSPPSFRLFHLCSFLSTLAVLGPRS